MVDTKTNLTWRELLKSLTSDPHEQQRITETLGINAMTLRRWINNETNPRPQNLRLLLNALPHHRRQLVTLLAVEFPTFKRETNELDEIETGLIQAGFYAQLISLYASVAQHLRGSLMSTLILRQMVKQFDPDLDGLLIMIAQCISPRPGQKVQGLRLAMGRGTHLWSTYIEQHPQLFGAESLVGYAVSSRHLTVLASREEYLRAFPYDEIEGVKSAVAAPIVLADQTMGGIYVASMQTNYFSPIYVSLLQKYVELLCLAFERDEFFPFSEIVLGAMPPCAQQLPYLATFQTRVKHQMNRASSENKTITSIQAEQIVWQQLQNELLHLAPEQDENK
ncbi:MAG: hypothetical protein H0U76_29410 [Ktedonobacteraceae bacterium]|nr:hypothetical protein [Ktedonobacteraceae bacterium]